MTLARCIVATATSILIACGGSNDARVGIDLTSLWDQAGMTNQIDVIHVRVYDDQGVLQVVDALTSTDAFVDLVVSAGPSRRFEVEAVFDDGGVWTPTYWGELVTDLQANDDIGLEVPVFPAGQLSGTVTVSDGTAIPNGTSVVATAQAPRAELPDPLEVLIDTGKFTVTLPTGAYDLTVGFAVAGGSYARIDGGPALDVTQGEIVNMIRISVGPQ